MLLFLLAERFLKLPQILCKMALKTDTRVHYHGADGVYAGASNDGVLKLFWGESRFYGDPTDAIRDRRSLIAPFLIEPEHEGSEREQDLMLLSDNADLNDAKLTDAIRLYFDKNSKQSKRVQYCGIALVGFDADYYPPQGSKGVADEVRSWPPHAKAWRISKRTSATASKKRDSTRSKSKYFAFRCPQRKAFDRLSSTRWGFLNEPQ